ncbi:MAG: tripartite tricarboxylate transporter TctB family protein [Alphaproteobacteria bacterium]|nr:tripartite tricarboxylate transporter TctB family protein [Alphaproteobacteria bacterium]
MRRAGQIASLCFVALFAATAALATNYAFFDALGPGPGFFPLLLGLAGVLLAAAVFVERRRQPAGEAALLPERRLWPVLLCPLAGLAFVALALEPIGFRLTLLLALPTLLLLLGARHPVAIGLSAIVGSLGVFHVFYYWLKVPLPFGAALGW